MAILWSHKELAAEGFGVDATNMPECLHCGEKVTLPAVYWVGPQTIWFHPTCARNWMLSFARDCWEVKNTLDDGKWKHVEPGT